MQYKAFGNTEIQVSKIGFGCARLGGFLQSETRHEIKNLLCQALDEGITFYDTADMYCQGESERLLGEAFLHNRDKVFIASKGGYCLPGRRRVAATIKPLLKMLAGRFGIERKHLPKNLTGKLSQNFTSSYLSKAVEDSLIRLKTDHLDLYQLHSPPTFVIESADFIGILEKLKAEGKIRYYGISCETTDDAVLCLRYPGISSLQLGVGLLDPEALQSAIPDAASRGLAIIARGCFGGGLLKPDMDIEKVKLETPKWPTVLACRQVADQNNRSLLEMALQFVLNSESVTTTLLGMRTASHLKANIQYASANCISPAEMNELHSAITNTSHVSHSLITHELS